MECTLIKQFVVSFFYCAVHMKYFWETHATLIDYSVFSKAKQCKV